MKVIPINRPACGHVRDLSDAFADSELLVETNLEIIRHASTCRDCDSYLGDAIRLKRLVRTAVESVQTPSRLRRAVTQLFVET